MRIYNYLVFNGTCEEAFRFYEQSLGGHVTLLRHSETPAADHVPPEWQEKIIHARLEVGQQVLMGSDGPPDYQETARGFSVHLAIDDAVEAERVFTALSAGGKVTMPFAETFWAYRFGMLVDRFGVPWMVNCEKAG